MNIQNLQTHFLLALITISFVLTALILFPFLSPLALAIVFAVVLYPVYLRLVKWFRSRNFSAVLTVIISILGILLPLALVGILVIREASDLYTSLATGGMAESALLTATTYIENTFGPYFPSLENLSQNITTEIDLYAEQALGWVVNHLGTAFSSVASLFVSLIIFFISLFYMLKDGPSFKQSIIELSPLTDSDDEMVFKRLSLAITSVIRGNLMIAFIQGILTAFGLMIFGVPNAILWGTVAAIAALIPAVGTTLVLLPAIIFVFITSGIAPAIGLLIWGVLAVGFIDNFLGPRLMSHGTELHPLFVLLSVIGGLAFFGPAGIFLGPLVINLFFAFISIYSSIIKRTRASEN